MDEILASIRRIIDAGDARSKPPVKPVEERVEPVSTAVPPPANDPGFTRMRAPQSMSPQQPQTRRAPDRVTPRSNAADGLDDDIEAAVSAYLAEESLSRKPARIEPELPDFSAFETPLRDSGLRLSASLNGRADEDYSSPAMDIDPTPAEPDMSEAEAVLLGDFSDVDRDLLAEKRAKYDARFSEADNGTFQKVGDLLRGTFEVEAKAPPAGRDKQTSLVSEAVSNSVSQSLSSLSSLAEALPQRAAPDLDAMAEEMLRPMLQEWLDNNLPSLVERLVRAEIERIARGEPRTA